MPRSLLFSQDEEAVKVLTRLFRDLDIDVDHYTDIHLSAQQLVDQKFAAIIVDTDNGEDTALLLHTVATLPSGQRGLLVVLARTQTAVHLEFSVGAHLALYKPISVERVGLGLRAIRNLAQGESVTPKQADGGEARSSQMTVQQTWPSRSGCHLSSNPVEDCPRLLALPKRLAVRPNPTTLRLQTCRTLNKQPYRVDAEKKTTKLA